MIERTSNFVIRILQREFYEKFYLSFIALNADGSFVGNSYRFGYRKPQSIMVVLSGSGGICLEESLKQLFSLLRRDFLPVIDDR